MKVKNSITTRVHQGCRHTSSRSKLSKACYLILLLNVCQYKLEKISEKLFHKEQDNPLCSELINKNLYCENYHAQTVLLHANLIGNRQGLYHCHPLNQ